MARFVFTENRAAERETLLERFPFLKAIPLHGGVNIRDASRGDLSEWLARDFSGTILLVTTAGRTFDRALLNWRDLTEDVEWLVFSPQELGGAEEPMVTVLRLEPSLVRGLREELAFEAESWWEAAAEGLEGRYGLYLDGERQGRFYCFEAARLAAERRGWSAGSWHIDGPAGREELLEYRHD